MNSVSADNKTSSATFLTQKRQMLTEHLGGRQIYDALVLKAFARVEREQLVPQKLRSHSYEDRPLEIGYGATISQPYIVAKTLQEARLEPQSRVLEIGTGSGYQTALLAEMGCDVYSIEVVPELSVRAQKHLQNMSYKNIHYMVGNGFDGWPGNLEFDAILLTAAPLEIPQKLLNQLRIGGRLVGPEGEDGKQWLYRITRTPSGFERERLLSVKFVPMVKD